jgi:hypothetical protein
VTSAIFPVNDDIVLVLYCRFVCDSSDSITKVYLRLTFWEVLTFL